MLRQFSIAFYKLFLFLFNFSFVIIGLLLMVTGLLIRGQYLKYEDFLSNNFFSLPSILIYTSAILIFTAFFGCCGTIQENKFMIAMYSVLMCSLFTTEIALGLTGYALSEETQNILLNSLNDTMQLYNRSDQLTRVWDSLQTNKCFHRNHDVLQLDCCGIDSYSDWYPVLNGSIPMSCCDPVPGAIDQEICNEKMSSLHSSSCLNTLTNIIKENASTLALVTLGVAILQILGIYFACSLITRIRKHYQNFD